MATPEQVQRRGRWSLLVGTITIGIVLLGILGSGAFGSGAPTISSDKDDYAPGELVTLTGSGWEAGESVHLNVNDDDGRTWMRNVDVTADDAGTISDQFNLPDWFVALYTVRATGAASGTVTTTFTDSQPGSITVAAPTSASVAQGATATYGNATITKNGSNDPCTLTLSSNGLPAGAAAVFGGTAEPATVTMTNLNIVRSLTVTTTGSTPAGTYSFTVRAVKGSNCQGPTGPTNPVVSNTLSLTVTSASVSTTTTASNATATYGDASVTLNATVAPATVNVGTVTFTVKDGATTIGTAGPANVALGNASASFSLAGVDAKTYTIEAAYSGGTGFNASNNSGQSPAPTLIVGKKNLTISGAVAQDKEYNGNANASVDFTSATLDGVVSGDTVSINSSASTASFADKNVALNKPVTVTGVTLSGADASNYTVSQPSGLTADITAKGLTVSGAVAQDKDYDGNAAATVDFTAASLDGVVGLDDVSIDSSGYAASFANKHVGQDKPVTVTGLELDGLDAGNYTLSQPSGLSADINQADLHINAVTDSKEYDGDTDSAGIPTVSGLQGTDTVTDLEQQFQSKNVLGPNGSTLVITDYTVNDDNNGNNYNVTTHTATGTITAKGLTVSGAVAQDKDYDGDAAATVDFTAASLDGVVGLDDVSIDSSGYAASFANKHVGQDKPVTVTGLELDGLDAGNYTLSQPSGLSADINQADLHINAVTDSKEYDGDTDSAGIPTVSGLQGTDTVTDLEQQFQSKNVLGPNGSTLVITDYTVNDGNNGNNYNVTTHTATGTITAKGLTVSGAVAQDKDYDGDAAATVDFTAASLDGVVGLDDVSIDSSGYAASFANKHVGQDKPVTVTGLELDGLDAGNYTLSQPSGLSADINQADLHINAVTDSKEYDGDTDSAGIPTVSGLQGTDTVTDLEQQFQSKNVLGPNGSTLVITDYTVNDDNNGNNYNVTTHTATGTITTKGLTVSGAVAQDKDYDGNAAATVDFTAASLDGVVGLDDVSIDSSGYAASFANKHVGQDKPVTVTGLELDGLDAGNYTLSQPSGLSADINQADLHINAVTDSKEYDGDTDSAGIPTVSGLQGTDTVTDLEQQFQSKNVLGPNGSTLVITDYTVNDGNNGNNYNVTTHTATGTITEAALHIHAVTDSKEYDGDTDSAGVPTVSGLQGTDSVTDLEQQFQSRNVLGPGGSTLVVTGYTVNDGNNGDNYNVTTHTATGTITKKGLTVTGITANNKPWNGNTTATLNLAGAALVGVVPIDLFTVALNTAGATGTFANSAVGTWTVTIAGLSLSGADAGNYSLTQPTTTASITAWNAQGHGFYQPVGVPNTTFTAAPGLAPTSNPGDAWNTVKGGSTVPLKFNVYAGSVEKTSLADIQSFKQAVLSNCSGGEGVDEVDLVTTGNTELRYSEGQWIQNWKTPKVTKDTCYRAWVTFSDGSSLEAFFKLRK